MCRYLVLRCLDQMCIAASTCGSVFVNREKVILLYIKMSYFPALRGKYIRYNQVAYKIQLASCFCPLEIIFYSYSRQKKIQY